MQLPRVRLPRLSLPLDWLGAFGGRITLLYVGYTAVLFALFFVLTFPHEMLIRRALSTVNRGQVSVEFTTADFAWLRGYEFSGVRVGPADGDARPPFVELSRLWVRPLLGDLARGNPYALQVRADLYGGAALGEVRLSEGNVVGGVQWQDINLGRYRTLTAFLDEGQLAGRVSGQFDFEARGGNLGTGQGSGEAKIDGAALTEAKIAGFAVPDLNLRQTRLKFTVRGGRLEVQEFTATGDVSVQGSGQIVLREPVQDSVLNLRATLQPTPTTPDAVKTLLAMIPRPPGAKPDAPMTVTGTLARPRVR